MEWTPQTVLFLSKGSYDFLLPVIEPVLASILHVLHFLKLTGGFSSIWPKLISGRSHLRFQFGKRFTGPYFLNYNQDSIFQIYNILNTQGWHG
jgi:hypothetical protein